VFAELGILLQKRVGFKVGDEIRRNILVGCGFTVTQDRSAGSEQGGLNHPLALFLDRLLPPAPLLLIPWCRIRFFLREKFL